jgi:hypothetical protein
MTQITDGHRRGAERTRITVDTKKLEDLLAVLRHVLMLATSLPPSQTATVATVEKVREATVLCEEMLHGSAKPSPMEAAKARYDRLQSELDPDEYRLLEEGEHVLEGDDIYTFDTTTNQLTWTEVNEDTPACGCKWALVKFMPVRREVDTGVCELVM